MRQHKKSNKKLTILTLITLVLVILGLALLLNWDSVFGDRFEPDPEPEPPKVTEISLLCVGDIMVHSPQLDAAYDSSTGEYDYSENYQYVKPYVQTADLALCNVETTFGGTPYTGYPAFSSPDSMAADIKEAGFDVAITANNHMTDRGYDGVIRTQEILEQNGLTVIGSVMTPDEPRYIIKDVKGVKVGIVAYTYETGSGSGAVSINGAYISDDTASVINSFNFNTLDEDCARIKGDIDAAKAAGAQVIVVYYHWGEEYQREANSWQKNLAQRTADMGADVIFASHPHVPQGMEYLTAGESGKKVPVFYSLGNFVSNQRSEYMGEGLRTEEGLMGTVDLTYKEGSGITSIEMDVVPLWVDRYSDGGKIIYTVIPLDDQMEENASLQASGHLSTAKRALEDINELLGRDSE